MAQPAPTPESSPAEAPEAYFPSDDVARATNCTIIDWMDPIDLTGAVPISLILLGCSWLFAFSGWEDYVDAVHTPWLRVVLPSVLVLLAASFIPRDFIPGLRNRKRARRARAEARAATRPQEMSETVAKTLLAHSLSLAGLSRSRPIGSMPALPLLYFDMAQYGLAVPRIILDRSIADAVLSIERPKHLLEPESIDSHGTRGRRWLSWAPLTAGVLATWYLASSTFLLVVLIALIGLALVASLIRWMRTGVNPGDSGYLAGVGYLEGPDGARMPSARVVTVVTKPRFRQMRVRLLAPTWNHELLFPSPRDPGFIAFWQRWNHPHPRPELLGEPAPT